MEIKAVTLGHIQSNCYMISTDKAALVIDPGFNSVVVTDFLKEAKDKERFILLTHAHFDHIGGALNLRNATNTKIAIGNKDNPVLSNTHYNLSDRFHAKLEPFSADLLLSDQQIITVGDITIKTIFTPGHTAGGVCYLIEDKLFSGDTLFYRSIGRTDFYDGNYSDIEKSIKKLYNTLPDTTVVFAGHGEKTTIGEEKYENPYIRGI